MTDLGDRFSRFGRNSCGNPTTVIISTAQGPLYRRLPACTNCDCDAGKMPALRVHGDLALYRYNPQQVADDFEVWRKGNA